MNEDSVTIEQPRGLCSRCFINVLDFFCWPGSSQHTPLNYDVADSSRQISQVDRPVTVTPPLAATRNASKFSSVEDSSKQISQVDRPVPVRPLPAAPNYASELTSDSSRQSSQVDRPITLRPLPAAPNYASDLTSGKDSSRQISQVDRSITVRPLPATPNCASDLTSGKGKDKVQENIRTLLAWKILARNRTFQAFNSDVECGWRGPFYFVQGADIQFGFIERDLEKRINPGCDSEVVLGELAVRKVNAMRPRPAFFVICGDLCHSEPGVEAVFCGHFHRNAGGKYHGMQVVVTTAIGGQLGKNESGQLGKDKSGVRVVKMQVSSLEHKFYPLEEIPSTVIL